MNWEILGWTGTALTILAFTLVNTKKYEWTFFPLNLIAAVILMLYEFIFNLWAIIGLHSYLAIMSAIKCYQLFYK